METVVDRVCLVCHRHFSIPAYRLKHGRGQFCSRSCKSHATACARHYHPTEEVKGKISESLKQRNEPIRKQRQEQTRLRVHQALAEGAKRAWNDLERRAVWLKNISEGHKRTWSKPEYKARMSQVHKELWKNPELQARASWSGRQAALKRWQNPEYRKNQINAQKAKWDNPEYVKQLLRSIGRKPNKLEQRLISICTQFLPDFRYNGDFSLGVSICGLIPDFVNVNGKKQVIEVFGDYWHSPKIIGNDWRRGELGKIMMYNSVGWKCLVLWEHELKQLSDTEILKKVSVFCGKK